MDETREKLRADFYAKTDITVNIAPESWQSYAEYLEEIAVEKINDEIITKNEKLIRKVEDVIKILENALMER